MKIIAFVGRWIGKIVECDKCGCQFIIEKCDKDKIIKQPVLRSFMPDMHTKLCGFDYFIKCQCGHAVWIGGKHLKRRIKIVGRKMMARYSKVYI